MSAIEKLCLSSSANDFHVSLDIIFWREGSFFNYAGASFAHYFPHNPWLMLEEEILLFYILWEICITFTFPVSTKYLFFST